MDGMTIIGEPLRIERNGAVAQLPAIDVPAMYEGQWVRLVLCVPPDGAPKPRHNRRRLEGARKLLDLPF